MTERTAAVQPARREQVFMPTSDGEIGAKVVSHGRYVTFQVAVSRQMFADILSLIARLRAPPAPA